MSLAEGNAASLSISISNLGKVKEVIDVPQIQRGVPSVESNKPSISLNLKKERQMEIITPPNDTDTKMMIDPDKLTDEDFDMKGTSRKEYENEFYKRICSEVIDGFLYLGSDFVASDKDIIK